MQNNGIPLPEVEKISKLIDALRDYALKSARSYWEDHLKDTYQAPCLASWDAFIWFELVQDWKLSDFLVSGSDKAKKLVKSLQACLQWYGQTEIDEILARMRLIRIINWQEQASDFRIKRKDASQFLLMKGNSKTASKALQATVRRSCASLVASAASLSEK